MHYIINIFHKPYLKDMIDNKENEFILSPIPNPQIKYLFNKNYIILFIIKFISN